MYQRREELIPGREELILVRSSMSEDRIAQCRIGDTFTASFSTTSPPAFVSDDYEITRKDRKGLWGVLIDSNVRDMELSEC